MTRIAREVQAMKREKQDKRGEPERAVDGAVDAIRGLLQYCVTPTGLPDKGKGRTLEQQAAMDAARAAISRAEGR